jgi:hypothetical protein
MLSIALSSVHRRICQYWNTVTANIYTKQWSTLYGALVNNFKWHYRNKLSFWWQFPSCHSNPSCWDINKTFKIHFSVSLLTVISTHCCKYCYPYTVLNSASNSDIQLDVCIKLHPKKLKFLISVFIHKATIFTLTLQCTTEFNHKSTEKGYGSDIRCTRTITDEPDDMIRRLEGCKLATGLLKGLRLFHVVYTCI